MLPQCTLLPSTGEAIREGNTHDIRQQRKSEMPSGGGTISRTTTRIHSRMAEKVDPTELDLTDSELVEVIRNHGIDRRTVMKVLGAGTLASLGSETVAADHDQPHPPHIDSYYGYSAPADERLPGKLRPDHTVDLRLDFSVRMPFYFSPVGLHVSQGDIVRFNFPTPEHTVTAYHLEQGRQQRVPDDQPPFSSPVINSGGFWLYEFNRPGTYDVFCAPHELLGMVMRIVVGDPDDDDYDGEFSEEGRPPVSKEELNQIGVTIPDPPFPAPHDVFETNALSVSNIVSEGAVSRADVVSDL